MEWWRMALLLVTEQEEQKNAKVDERIWNIRRGKTRNNKDGKQEAVVRKQQLIVSRALSVSNSLLKQLAVIAIIICWFCYNNVYK